MGAWVVRGGRDGVWEEHDLQHGEIVVGWVEVPDLSQVDDPERAAQIVADHLPDDSKAQNNRIVQFRSEMAVGDIVVLPFKGGDDVAVGEVTGDYRYLSEGPEGARHARPVRWISTSVSRVRFGQDLRRVFNSPATLSPIRAPRAEPRLRTVADEGSPDGYEPGGALHDFSSPVLFVHDNLAEVPDGPGAHAVWSPHGELLYVGYTRGSHRDRLLQHLSGDRQASILHKRVGEFLDRAAGGTERDEIRDYLHTCRVAWLQTESAEEVKARAVRELEPRFRGRVEPSRQIWLFQGNPDRFDVRGLLAASAVGSTDTWTVSRYKSEISPGDLMVLWEAGPQGGIHALAQITGTVETSPGRDLGDSFVPFQFLDILDEPIPREVVATHEDLSDLGPLQFHNATNYRVTPEQWRALSDLTGWSDDMTTAPVSADFEGPFFIFNRSALTADEASGHDDITGVQYAFDGGVAGQKALREAGSGSFVYYHTGRVEGPTSKSFAGVGRIDRVEEDGEVEGKRRYRALLSDYRPLPTPVPRRDATPKGWNTQHSIAEISETDFRRILSRARSASASELTLELIRNATRDRGLIVPDAVLASVVAALRSGKHVMLTGPPGTGKTTLAEAVGAAAFECGLADDVTLTTATGDWTTFDTIGGLRPTETGELEFQAGQFLRAIEDASWLVVDELNRSNFDRAFGQLFTVLSGQPVVLPFDDPETGGPISVVPEPRMDDYDDWGAAIVVPTSWRMIGTMNVFDKSLLFEMSYALMRRFAFIEVAAPDDATYLTLIHRAVGDGEAEHRDRAAAVTQAMLALRRIKELGPALFIDMARYAVERLSISPVSDHDLAFELFYSYLLPQFEGIDEVTGRALLTALRNPVGADNMERLRATLNTVLGLELQRAVAAAAAPDEAVEMGET